MVCCPRTQELVAQVRHKEEQPSSTYLHFKYTHIWLILFLGIYPLLHPNFHLCSGFRAPGPHHVASEKVRQAGGKSTLISQHHKLRSSPSVSGWTRRGSPRGLSPLRGCGLQRGTAQRSPRRGKWELVSGQMVVVFYCYSRSSVYCYSVEVSTLGVFSSLNHFLRPWKWGVAWLVKWS